MDFYQIHIFLQLLFNPCPIFDADFSHKQKKMKKMKFKTIKDRDEIITVLFFFNEIHTYSFMMSLDCHYYDHHKPSQQLRFFFLVVVFSSG